MTNNALKLVKVVGGFALLGAMSYTFVQLSIWLRDEIVKEWNE